MKTFDILYRRSKTSAIVYYKIWVDEGDVDHAPIIVKESGQLGTTSPIIHRETIHQGMNIGKSNETTPVQQAILQVESDWRKKKDGGYKSSGELGIQTKNIDPVEYHFNKLLDAALPQFNTDASGNIKPMLAKDWTKVKNIQYPCIIEPKLDGVRCLMTIAADEVLFWSRSGKEYTTLGHISQSIVPYLNAQENKSIWTVLDGEIYSDELTFQEITQAVKKQYPNSLKLHFRAYDVVNDEIQSDRRVILSDLVKAIGSEFIKMIGYTIANDEAAVKHFHDEFVQEGNEGAILRMFNGLYEQGFRSSNLLKVKEFDEAEFQVESLVYGQRGIEDLLAVCTTPEGSVFKAKIQGTLAQKVEFEKEYQEVYASAKPIKLTVKHFGWTDDKLPRFPIGKALRLYE